jgi:3-oxoacyl-[acyl-carrier protein] reductase
LRAAALAFAGNPFAAARLRRNCVSAGLVDTTVTADVPAEIRAELLSAVPLGRAGRREEIAAAVGFLCSERASYVTGQIIAVDGGLT